MVGFAGENAPYLGAIDGRDRSTASPGPAVPSDVFVERLMSIDGGADRQAWAALGVLRAATACRVWGDADALAELDEAPRRQILSVLVTTMAPTPGLASVARETILDARGGYRDPAPGLMDRMAAVWSGLSPELAGWDELTEEQSGHCIGRLIAGGYPPPEGLDRFMRALLTEGDREAALAAWCRERTWTASDAETAWLAHCARPMVRLEAMASVVGNDSASQLIAREWLSDAVRVWQEAPRHDIGRALADGRLAVVLAASGDLASAEGLLARVLEAARRERDPGGRARIYRVAFEAAASVSRHEARDGAVVPWLRVGAQLRDDQLTQRAPEARLEAQAAALRTLPRVVRSGGPLTLEHALGLAGELCRAEPEPWLELLELAIRVEVHARAKRPIDAELKSLSERLQRDALPRPIDAITLEEVVRYLLAAAPDAVLRLGERLTHPVQRGLWWASAAPHAG